MSDAVLTEDLVVVRAVDLDTHEQEIAFWRAEFAARLVEDTSLHALALLGGTSAEVEALGRRMRAALATYDAALAGEWNRSSTEPTTALQQAAVNARNVLDLTAQYVADHGHLPGPLKVPCPHCADGFVSHGDRHTRTRMDVCSACGGTHEVPAATGQTPEASFDPADDTEAADSRDVRQEQMRRWISRIWGEGALHPHERVERLLEETVELAQAEKLPGGILTRAVRHLLQRIEASSAFPTDSGERAAIKEVQHALRDDRVALIADAVYAKEPGEPAQEIGGISTCLLAYCAATAVSADDCERAELTRILGKTPEHFRTRHQAKVEAGMARPYAPPSSETEAAE